MRLSVTTASDEDAAELVELRNAVADDLTLRFGKGHWSYSVTEKSVLRGIRTSRVLLGRMNSKLIATLLLATKKPWAIDVSYFTPVKKALYLHNMAVSVDVQGQGLGRELLVEAAEIARAWPSNAIRLDAYDADAGAGPFYAKCGYSERGRVVYRSTPLVYYELLL